MKNVTHFALSIVLSGVLGCASSSASHPDLSGKWKLNEAQSETPRDKMREMRGGRGGRGGFGGGMGGGRGGWGGGVMGPGGGGRRGRWGGGRDGGMRGEGSGERGRLREMLAAPETLEITQQGDAVTLRSDDGSVHSFHVTGKRESNQFEGMDVSTKARWKDQKMIIESDFEEGPSVTDVYELSPDGRQLIDKVTIEGRMRMTLRRVYDRE